MRRLIPSAGAIKSDCGYCGPTPPLSCLTGGAQEIVEFQVDTGSNGSIQLPLEIVTRLGLSQEEPVTMRLSDGRRVQVPVYRASVIWDGVEKSVDLPAAGRQPLLGTGLLDGHRLNAAIKPGGRVTIKPL